MHSLSRFEDTAAGVSLKSGAYIRRLDSLVCCPIISWEWSPVPCSVTCSVPPLLSTCPGSLSPFLFLSIFSLPNPKPPPCVSHRAAGDIHVVQEFIESTLGGRASQASLDQNPIQLNSGITLLRGDCTQLAVGWNLNGKAWFTLSLSSRLPRKHPLRLRFNWGYQPAASFLDPRGGVRFPGRWERRWHKMRLLERQRTRP